MLVSVADDETLKVIDSLPYAAPEARKDFGKTLELLKKSCLQDVNVLAAGVILDPSGATFPLLLVLWLSLCSSTKDFAFFPCVVLPCSCFVLLINRAGKAWRCPFKLITRNLAQNT